MVTVQPELRIDSGAYVDTSSYSRHIRVSLEARKVCMKVICRFERYLCVVHECVQLTYYFVHGSTVRRTGGIPCPTMLRTMCPPARMLAISCSLGFQKLLIHGSPFNVPFSTGRSTQRSLMLSGAVNVKLHFWCLKKFIDHPANLRNSARAVGSDFITPSSLDVIVWCPCCWMPRDSMQI